MSALPLLSSRAPTCEMVRNTDSRPVSRTQPSHSPTTRQCSGPGRPAAPGSGGLAGTGRLLRRGLLRGGLRGGLLRRGLLRGGLRRGLRGRLLRGGLSCRWTSQRSSSRPVRRPPRSSWPHRSSSRQPSCLRPSLRRGPLRPAQFVDGRVLRAGVLTPGLPGRLHAALQHGHQVHDLALLRRGRGASPPLRQCRRPPSSPSTSSSTASRYSSCSSDQSSSPSVSISVSARSSSASRTVTSSSGATPLDRPDLVRPQHRVQRDHVLVHAQHAEALPPPHRQLGDGDLPGALQRLPQQRVRLGGGPAVRRQVVRAVQLDRIDRPRRARSRGSPPSSRWAAAARPDRRP